MEYKTEQLSDTVQVAVSKQHTFGTDALLLGNFAKIEHKKNICDFGCGCGILSLLAATKNGGAITGVDIQPEAIALFSEGIRLSGLSSRVTARLADIKSLDQIFPRGGFDLILCNPPYKAANTGMVNQKGSAAIARHEVECTFDDIAKQASVLLRFGGEFCCCGRPERLVDVLCALRKYKLEPKRLRFVAKNNVSTPWLFLIEAKKHSGAFLKVEPLYDLSSSPLHFGNVLNPSACAGKEPVL